MPFASSLVMRLHVSRFALFASIAVGALACDRGSNTGPSAGALTGPQQAQVQQIYQQDGQQLLGLRQQLTSKQYELGTLWTSDRRDESRIQALTNEVSGLDAKVLAAETAMQQRLAAAGCTMCVVPGAGGWAQPGNEPGMMGPWMMGRGMVDPGMMGPGMMGPGMMGPGMMSWGRLTSDQQAKLRAIYRTDGQRLLQLRQQLATKQNELSALAASQNPDEDRLQILTKEVTALDEQIVKAQVAMQRDLASIGVPASSYGGCPMCGV